MFQCLTPERLAIACGTAGIFFITLCLYKLWKYLFCTMSELGLIIWNEINNTPIDKWNKGDYYTYSNDKIKITMNGFSCGYEIIKLYEENVTYFLWNRDAMHLHGITSRIWRKIKKRTEESVDIKNLEKQQILVNRYKKESM